MLRTRSAGASRALAALAGAAIAGSAMAQKQVIRALDRHAQDAPISLTSVPVLRVGPGGRAARSPGSPMDACNVVASLTTANFNGDTFTLEGGFAETEMAAATYTVAAAEFPITINLAEVILATRNATQQTTTQWSMLFYSGTPAAGTLVATYSSDDVILPYARVGPGTAGLNIQFSIDPQDPEQLIIPDNGSHQFTFAFRIDHHNAQSGNPCLTAPPTCCNAFPVVDCCSPANGCQGCTPNFPAANWLFGVNCGPFGCPANGGWSTFSNLASFCRPSGDWVMRATWSGVNCTPGVGSCCLPNGTCQVMTTSNCTGSGGTYRGDGTDCLTPCPQPTGACCFSNGSCLNQTQSACTGLGGVWLGGGSACSGNLCPTGACCLPNGTCVAGQTSAQCAAQNGVFRGVNTTCANPCPQPTGACCTSGGGCGVLSQNDCTLIGGVWHGAGTQCGGTICQTCYANCDGSTSQPLLNVNDFVCFQTKFAAGDSYANCDGSTAPPVLNVNDFVCFQQAFAQGCP